MPETARAPASSTLTPIRVSLSARTDFIFFPIDYGDLINYLTKRGYVAATRTPPARGGVKIGVAGYIAQKGDNAVVFDPDKQVIGIEGTSPIDVAQAYEELEEIIVQDLKTELATSTKFYETISDSNVVSDRNPRKVLESLPGVADLSKRMSAAIGVEISPFGFRMGSRGLVPNQEEWMDIRVEPVTVRADSTYYVAIVYRSQSREKVKTFVESSGKIIPQIVRVIEGS